MHISFSVHFLLVLLGIGIIGSHAAPFSPYRATLSSRAQACDAPTTCDACLAVTTAKCVFVPSSGKCQTSGNKNPRSSIISASGCVNVPVVKSLKDTTVEKAAQLAFNAVKTHVFEGKADKPNSGRHLLSVWTEDNKKNPAKTTPIKGGLGKLTGIVAFQDGEGIKTVWNDADGTGATAGVPKLNKNAVEAMCIAAYTSSILANPANQAALKTLASPPVASGSKSKVKAAPKVPEAKDLKIQGGAAGDNEGFVVLNTAVTPHQLVCINVLTTTCYPLGVNPVQGLKAGEPCSAQDTNIED